MKVYVATAVRGFLTELFNRLRDIEFEYNNKTIYEKLSKKKILLNKIAKSKFVSHLGIVRTITPEKNDADIVFSYNKFLNTNQPYVIYLENPYALVNYSITKPSTFLGKKNVNKQLNNPSLKAIVGLSDASFSTFKKIYDVPSHVTVSHIPPLIANRDRSSIDFKRRANQKELKCIYISSRFELKGGSEIIEVFEKLKVQNITNIKIKIITVLDTVKEIHLEKIKGNENIELLDFNLSKEELNDLYSQTNIIINLSRMDSFGLVLLESMKYGVVPISTDLYAIPEFIKDGVNGYLNEPKFRFFNKDNFPNEYVWNNREKTIYSEYVDENLAVFLYQKLLYLNNNRTELEKISENSYFTANNNEYSEENIVQEWTTLFDTIMKENTIDQ